MSASQAAQLAALVVGVIPSVQAIDGAGPTQVLATTTWIDWQYTAADGTFILPSIASNPLNRVIVVTKSTLNPFGFYADPGAGSIVSGGSIGVPYLMPGSRDVVTLADTTPTWILWCSFVGAGAVWQIVGRELIDKAAAVPSLRTLYTSTPAEVGTAFAGSSTKAAAGDHSHAMGDASVTMAKLADVAASTVIGRPAGSTGVPSALAVAHSLIADGTGLHLSGDAASPSGAGGYGTNDAGTRGWFADSQWDAMRIMPTYGTRRTVTCVTDFWGGGASLGGWVSDTSNGANTFPVTDTLGRVGIARSSTTSNAAGAAGFRMSVGDLVLGLGRLPFRTEVRLTQLSNGTDSFWYKAGFGEMYTNALPVDGAYFRYTHGTNSGKFQCVAVSNSVEVTADSGITVVAGTWYVLEHEVNAAGTQARFWINGTLVATISSGLPPATLARATDAGVRIFKTLGTGVCTVDHDYLAMRWDLTTPF